MVTDVKNNAATESIFISKITRINQQQQTAFINYTENNTGFINLNKQANYQTGSSICTQLTWQGNNSKQAKFRTGFELIGKYLIYQQAADKCYIKAKQLNEQFTLHLQENQLAIYPAHWLMRSSVTQHTDVIAITAEAQYLYQQAETIAKQIKNSSTTQQLYSGTANYLRTLRELNLNIGCEVITNDNHINQQLLDRQNIWQIDAITHDTNLNISQQLLEYQYHCSQTIFQTKNKIIIEYGELSGIHLFDINSNDSNMPNHSINYDCIESIYTQVCLRNLQGIILIDIIKNTGTKYENKLLHQLTKLFKQDISQTQVLGISHSGLIEIIRNKY
jgi:ribonuclease G